MLARNLGPHPAAAGRAGDAARRYNVLQKFAYIVVIFVLLPLMVLTGLTMSPAVTAAVPVLFDLFGGRQSARTIHFLVANLLVLFVLVHVVAGLARRRLQRDALDDHRTLSCVRPRAGARMSRSSPAAA